MLKERENLEVFVTNHIFGPGLSNSNRNEAKMLIGIAMIAIKRYIGQSVYDEIMKYNLTIRSESERIVIASSIKSAIERMKI